MHHFTLGQYYPASSPIHRMDPRAKILVGILYIVCTFLCRNILSFGAMIVSLLFLILVSRIPVATVLRSLKPMFFIILFTSVINVFMTKGETLLTPDGWFIHVYAEGLWKALFMLLRIMFLIAGTGIFLSFTTTPIALTDGMEWVLSPLKIFRLPVHDFAMMMSIALRFIPILSDETERIMNAQRARGVNFSGGSLLRRAKALIPILIPLLVSAINRAVELANAMECRCYHGGEGRTRLHVLRFSARDLIAGILVIALGVAIVFLNRSGVGYTL